MTNFLQIKVPQGKLLQLEKREKKIKITGDFFCHPEDIIQSMEKTLEKEMLFEDKKRKLQKIFQNPKNTIIGFSLENLLELFEKLSNDLLF